MTLPDERYRAVNSVREFLRGLLDPKETPRIPRSVRREAYYLLKHFPLEYEMQELAKKSPKILRREA